MREMIRHLELFFFAQNIGQTVVTQGSGRGALAAIEPRDQVSGDLPGVDYLLLTPEAAIEVLPGVRTQRYPIQRECLEFFVTDMLTKHDLLFQSNTCACAEGALAQDGWYCCINVSGMFFCIIVFTQKRAVKFLLYSTARTGNAWLGERWAYASSLKRQRIVSAWRRRRSTTLRRKR